MKIGFAVYAAEESMRHENLLDLCERQNNIVSRNPWAKAVTFFKSFELFIDNLKFQGGLSRSAKLL